MRVNGTDIGKFNMKLWKYERVLPDISNNTGFVGDILSPVWSRPVIGMPHWKITLRVTGDTRYECERCARLMLSKFYQNARNTIELDPIWNRDRWTPARTIIGSLSGSNYAEIIQRKSHRLILDIVGYEVDDSASSGIYSDECNDERDMDIEGGEVVDSSMRSLAFSGLNGSLISAPIKIMFSFYVHGVAEDGEINVSDRIARVSLAITSTETSEITSSMTMEFRVSDGYNCVTIDMQSGEISVRNGCHPLFDADDYVSTVDSYGPGVSIVSGIEMKEIPCIRDGIYDVEIKIETYTLSYSLDGSSQMVATPDTYRLFYGDQILQEGSCVLYMLHGVIWYDAVLG